MKKIIKKMASIVTAMAMVSSYAYVASAKSFPDVPTSHWAYDTINKLTDSGVFSGYDDGLFRPDNTITHEEFTTAVVTYVCDKLGQTVTPVGSDYVQVTTDDLNNPQFWTNRWAAWAQPYLNKAVELGIIGDSNDTIRKDYDVAMTNPEGLNSPGETLPGIDSPMQDAVRNVSVNTPITREEAARIVTRALFLTEPETLETVRNIQYNPDFWSHHGVPSFIPDWNNISPAYKYDVYFAYMSGIMNGDESYMLNPQSNMARSESTMIMAKLADASLRPEDIDNDVRYLAKDTVQNVYLDAICVRDAEPIRYGTNVNNLSLLELACRKVIQEHKTSLVEGLYVYTDERINEILETAKGTFYESMIKKLMDEVAAGLL